MGLLDYGTAAQSFADNFLKTYMAFGEDQRAEEGQKLAREMANAKLKEIAEEEAMRKEMAAYNQGLLSPVMGPEAPIPQMSGQFPVLGMPTLGDPGLLSQPTLTKQYPNSMAMWQAQGKSPISEQLLGMLPILAKTNPVAAMQIGATLDKTQEQAEAKESSLALREAIMKMNAEMQNRMMDFRKESLDETTRHNRQSEIISTIKANKPSSSGGSKKSPEQQKQEKQRRAQILAKEDLSKIYRIDTLTGSWIDLKTNRPVSAKVVWKEYDALIKTYGGDGMFNSPSGGAGGYINKALGR